jgi:superfamily II RNA helicase
MVVICKDTFSQDALFQEHFETFPFPLSDFQKYAIQAIVEGNHILVTAHTGSGKTLPAEFAIEHFVAKGKKVIYTSPIKALSNQKFHEFTKKFPHISFGILTGDIKFNPEADVLIMTTEILRNTLLQKTIDNQVDTNSVPLQFEMDFQNELAAVVFDEIHYINDQDRGKVWEETIMFLPSHIQMIMLSATIDKSEIFAQWIEDVKTTEEHQKKVYLAPTTHRVVPLKHYFYTTLPQGPIKNIKDKEFLKYVNGFLHKPIPLKDGKSTFNRENYDKVRRLLEYTTKNDCHVKPSFVLNEVTKYLYENEMLPAICFVFSRKLVERFAQTINLSLFGEDEAHIPSIMRRECEQILRKLPNFKEYINLPEFEMIMKLLEKGVAIHHSGIMPIFREMIELLFAKGYVKLLFATETFAVGINMPTKTVLFTGFDKFNGSSMRMLYSHEYTQMAGRAGRRGLDTIGHVIHLNNMFNLPYGHDYEQMINGNPQTLQSKFAISYNLVLNFLQFNNNTLDFASKSMSSGEIQRSIQSVENTIVKLKTDLCNKEMNPTYEYVVKNTTIFKNYLDTTEELKTCKQKMRKQLQRTLENIENNSKQFKGQLEQYKSMIVLKEEIRQNEEYIETLNKHFQSSFNRVVQFLEHFDYVKEEHCKVEEGDLNYGDKSTYTSKFVIQEKGGMATFIQETHCLAFTDFLIKNEYLKNYSAFDIAALLSCFANIRVKDDKQIHNVSNLTANTEFNELLFSLQNVYGEYMNEELRHGIETNDNLNCLFELVNPILNWCESEDEKTCKDIIQKCEYEYEIFPGEFIKAILKINNMVNELKNVAEYMGNVELLHKLTAIHELTLKFIATNQSLYV